MKHLQVSQCLAHTFVKVSGSSQPTGTYSTEFFAVYERVNEEDTFCGLVSTKDIISKPGRCFYDLINNNKFKIYSHQEARSALAVIKKHKLDCLAVFNVEQEFIGMVTRLSLLENLYKHTHNRLLHRSKHYFSLKATVKHMEGHDLQTGFANFSRLRHQLNILMQQNPDF
jgi:predicted transcriptional regulator